MQAIKIRAASCWGIGTNSGRLLLWNTTEGENYRNKQAGNRYHKTFVLEAEGVRWCYKSYRGRKWEILLPATHLLFFVWGVRCERCGIICSRKTECDYVIVFVSAFLDIV